MIETAENVRSRVRRSPRRSRTSGPCARTRGRLRRSKRACSPTRPSRSTVPAAQGRRRSGHDATSTRAPAPRSSAWPGSSPSWPSYAPDATVTAGNSSGQNDAAAVAIVTTPARRSARPAAPGAAGQLVAGRCGAAPHGHRTGAGGPARAQARRALVARHRPDRAERGVRGPGARLLPRLGPVTRRTSSASTSTARASRWVTRSAPPAVGSWPTSCARWTAERRDYGMETMCIGRRSGPGGDLRAGGP